MKLLAIHGDVRYILFQGAQGTQFRVTEHILGAAGHPVRIQMKGLQ